MPSNYTVYSVQIQKLLEEFPFVQDAVLKAGYKFWPETQQGPFRIEKPGCHRCAMFYSNYFNGAMTALLRAVRDVNSGAVVEGVVDYVRENEQVFPNQENMEVAEIAGRMSDEYVFIGTKERGIITPILKKVRNDNSVKWGLFHILQRHYEGVSGLGFEKGSLFPSNTTVNEILCAIVKAVVEGAENNSSENRIKLNVPVEMGGIQSARTDPHLLVAERTANPKTFTTVTLFPNIE